MSHDTVTFAHLDGLHTGGVDLEILLSDTTTLAVLASSGGTLAVHPVESRSLPPYHLHARDGTVFGSLVGSDSPAAAAEAAANLQVSVGGQPFVGLAPYEFTPAGTPRPAGDPTLIVQHAVSGAPTGDLRYVDLFHDDRFLGRWPGTRRPFDLLVENSYEGVIRGRTPDVPFLESIQTAVFRARSDLSLIAAAGFYSSEEVRAPLRARHDADQFLLALASHTRSTTWLESCPTPG